MTENQTWWNRPAGVSEVLRVALPLVISSLSWTVMTFVDRMMLFWVSGEAMTAAFHASLVWFQSLCLPLGICAFTNTFVAQYFGNRQYEKVGQSAWQGIWLAIAFIPLCILAGQLAPLIFRVADHPPSIITLERIYFSILVWGSGGMLISQAASAFFGGQGRTWIVMVVDAAFALVNLVLDYVFIFGLAGIPAMGIAGAGYATIASLWMKAAFYLWLMLRPGEDERFATRRHWRPVGKMIRSMIRYGGPAGLQMVIDVSGFTVFVLLVGQLGNVAAEASSMAFSISSFAFMPLFGFGQAAGILVGQHLGENRENLASRSGWNAIGLGLIYMAVISFLYVAVPEFFLWGFFVAQGNLEEGNSAEVRELAIVLLRFVAAYNMFDAALTVFSGALKGAGDTVFILVMSIVMGIALAVGSFVAIKYFDAGVMTCWYIITAWVWFGGVVYFWRFARGRWRSIRVIDAQTIPAK